MRRKGHMSKMQMHGFFHVVFVQYCTQHSSNFKCAAYSSTTLMSAAECSVISFTVYYIIGFIRDPECFHHTVIIEACLSHTSATFPLAVMHLTRQFSSRQRDWQGHNEAWQNEASRFVWGEMPGHFCLIWTRNAERRETGKNPNGKLLERRHCQAIGLNIIRKKGLAQS